MIGDIMTKTQFPKGFLWGASTSAFQIEGGFDEGGKGPATTDIGTETPILQITKLLQIIIIIGRKMWI